MNKFRNERLDNNRPFKGTIELTYRCNERCSHCYLENFSDDKDKMPDFSQWQKIMRELKDGGVLYLDFIGGEPMLHPNFWDILEEAVDQGFYTGIISNGLLIDEQAVNRFDDLGVSNITLSLYSLDAGIHDGMTNVKGSHERIMRAIELLADYRVAFSLNCLLTKHNIDSYFELEDWARNNNYRINPDPFITAKTNGDLAPLRERASFEQLHHFYREKAKRDRWNHFEKEMVAEDKICGAGKLKCAVDRYGNLLTCLEIRDPLGSLLENSFENLWQTKRADYWRNLKNKDLKNLSCTSGFSCDHCPGAARQESGDELLISQYANNIQMAKNNVLATLKKL